MAAFSAPVFITTPKKPPSTSTSTNRETPCALEKQLMGTIITSESFAGVMTGRNRVMMAMTMVSRISTVNAVGMRNDFFCFFTRDTPFG